MKNLQKCMKNQIGARKRKVIKMDKDAKKKQRAKVVELRIPSLPEFVGVARLTLSGVASRMNFSYDDIEDLKIALAEACTNAIQHAYEQNDKQKEVTIRYFIETDKLIVEVEDKGKGFDLTKSHPVAPDLEQERGLGLFLIKALVDELELESDKKIGTKIRMHKYRD